MISISKLLHRPPVACAVISLLVFAVILTVRALGLLQVPELLLYDHMVEARTQTESRDDRIVLIGMTEKDLVDFGYPLADRELAKVFRMIDAQKPVVIAVDLYRDLPEPRNREGYPDLESAYRELKSIISIERVGYFKGPPALADEPDRIVANNLPRDFDGVFRRGLIAAEKGLDEPFPSLSLAATLRYLETKNVEVSFVAGPDGKQVIKLGKTIIPRLTGRAGGYVNAEPPDYEYLCNFEAPRKFKVMDAATKSTPHDYSFGQVLRGEIPAGALAGKIVFMATVMESIKDSNPTPVDNNLRGVEQHVMLTHQLLRTALDGVPPMTWWPEWGEVLWIALAAGLGGIVGLLLHSPWKIVPAVALLIAAFYFSGMFAFYQRVWIPIAAPMICCTLAAAIVTSLVAYLESAERGMLKTIFSKHISGPVVDALMKDRDQFLDGGRLKPTRVTATVLFTDLKGFSTTSEAMEPAALMEWMNEYFDGIATHVDNCGGIINKFIGDAIMGVFGVPVGRTTEAEMDTDAKNAVDCALAMRASLLKLNEGWSATGRPTTAMRIGIHTGALVSGNVGSEARLEYTVLGDTVNTAARLESAGKDVAQNTEGMQCMILISDATCQRLHGGYVTRPLGAINLKGKAVQVVVHSVISKKHPTDL